ncbi:hypothetical protein D9Q98_002012 [Chlorella vulgaris]|uniref:Uncharacterized protein n=1 Tax=Chlorella vulgaris TaxID=3077 RepID=A0A9D4TVH2_CHLVU|nr:hypothetical protein D9Q98_002012 [Chlorella vulgaris]
MEASTSSPIPVQSQPDGQGRRSGDWITVTKKQQRQRRRAAAAANSALLTSLAASEGECSSPGSSTPEASEAIDLLSTSLPSPQKAVSLPRAGLLAHAVERASACSTPLASPRVAPDPGLGSTPVDSSTSNAAAAAMPEWADGGSLLARQDSLSQSALDLHDYSKRTLRSSKSDIASLSIATARQRHAEDGTGSGAGGSRLDGISESAQGGGGAGGAGSSSVTGQPSTGVPQAATAAPLRRGRVAAGLGQPFSAYLSAELHPGPSYHTADVVWGQSERDRVYNALVAVPYQLERLMLFGVAVCLDSFLAIFTLLPLRVGVALLALARGILSLPGVRGQGDQAGAEGEGQRAGQRVALRGDQLFDLLSAAMSLGVVLFLWNLNAGTLYFWMKDLTQELLKLSVLYTALELSDKICCSFGVDVLEALAASCTQLAAGWDRRAAYNVACDVLVASLLLSLHGATLMSQAMVFGVAMNSKKNTLVALLIAANFTEIKGTVLKRFDATKLYSLACQDVVERFHLLLVLAFVVVEEMGNSGARTPNPVLLAGCVRIYAGEVVIDIIKHAVLGKFNEIRPGVYREFMRDLCDRVSGAQSHNIHKLVGFEPFAPSALFFRIALTAAALRHDGGRLQPMRVAAAVPAALGLWALLLLAKLGLGYLLKVAATHYVAHYEARRAGGRAGPLRRPGAAATTHQQPKKEV